MLLLPATADFRSGNGGTGNGRVSGVDGAAACDAELQSEGDG